MTELIHKKECYQIIGACMRVHTEMGSGFLESVYKECLELEFDEASMPFRAQEHLSIHFKEHLLKQSFIADFLIFDSIILEIKAVRSLTSEHESQLLNYLSATGFKLGLLANFGSTGKLEYKRLAKTH